MNNRYNPPLDKGLSEEQVKTRIENNLVNFDNQPKTKTIKQIIKDNFFTYFNFLNLALGIAVFIAGILNGDMLNSLKNCLFMGVIIINSIISIVEEIISKKIIDRLSLINENEILVIRDGKEKSCNLNELVLDDIIKVKTGHQIVADSIVMEGTVEANESFLTGEADAVIKKKGDLLLSGSFIVSGNCLAKVEHIGNDNYVSKITKEAKYQKPINSVILKSFEDILKVISYAIIPLGIIMFISQYNTTLNITESIFASVAALIGMIPEGLVLLTSSVMAVSVIRLSKYKVLVQQLYCIETLARVDVICLDKTGTLTEGKMAVKDIVQLNNNKEIILEYISAYVSYSQDENATLTSLKNYTQNKTDYEIEEQLAFSSERKYSAMSFKNHDTLFIGAPEYLLPKSKLEKIPKLSEYQDDYRVLLVAQSKNKDLNQKDNIEALGLVLIEDVIRENAKETLEYFQKQGVSVKIISGDNVKTVIKIAHKVGLKNVTGIDVENLSEEELSEAVTKYDIFGRVKPNEKKVIVTSLQNKGRCVAMTGDGVNDVLALKKSDCAISISSGTEAARNVAQLVSLNDNFDSLPKIVAEGRRTINNIGRSSSLLLVKTFYTVLLIIYSIIVGSKYFFIPIQLTLITGVTIGIPSFLLALEPNNDLVKGNFLLKIVSKSIPGALTVFFNVVLITLFSYVFNLDFNLTSTLSVYLTAVTGFIFLYKICIPFTFWRKILFSSLLLGFIYCITFQYKFFNLIPYTPQTVLIGLVLIFDSLYVFKKLYDFSIKMFHKIDPTIE